MENMNIIISSRATIFAISVRQGRGDVVSGPLGLGLCMFVHCGFAALTLHSMIRYPLYMQLR